MLYETLLQGKIFLCTVYFGILASFVFEAKFLILKLLKNIKFFQIFFEIVAMIFCSAIFLFCVLKYNYGIFRLYEIVGFCFGILAEYFSLHKLVEKNLDLIYNFLVKLLNKLKRIKFVNKLLK